MPQRDEALKSLVVKFEAAPGSRAFVELAAALLARGHASESLRVAEHGLQLVPDSVEGRVERAAALLALGRPRVAYVELVRALAIHPGHKRGMRLLGKTFRDAGAPGRAAKLLAKRSKLSAHGGSKSVNAGPKEPAWQSPPPAPPASSTDHVPALFSALTKDLGLGGAVPVRKAPPRVEVTQIMRRKAAPRPPRSASELVEIDGPIVDTTQPGQLEDLGLSDEPADVTTREPAPLWHDRTPGLTGLALDDEPLFQEHMPFAVRPVSADAAQTTTESFDSPAAKNAGSQDTVVDEIEDSGRPLESVGAPAAPMSLSDMPGPPELPRPATSDLELPPPLKGSGGPKRSPAPNIDTAQAPRTPARADATKPMTPRPDPRAATHIIPKNDTAPLPSAREERPFEPVGALVEKSVRKDPGLQVQTPPTDPKRLALAALAMVLMLAYVGGLLWFSGDTLSVWWSDGAKGSAAVESAVDTDDARAQRP